MEKNNNISELATFYLIEPKYLELIGCPSDEPEWVDGITVEENNLPSIDYYFDEDLYKEAIDEAIADFPHYIIKAKNCTWDHKTGYKIYANKYDTLARDYDVDQIYISSSPDKKIMKIMEYSHDVPTGYPVTIIGLTESEFAHGNYEHLIRNIERIIEKRA